MELAYIDVPDEFTGAVISKLQQRKGELRNMGSIAGGYTRLEFISLHVDLSDTVVSS